MIKVTIWILFLAFASYGLFCGLLYTKQRSMLYYPTLPVHSDTAEVFWLENEGQSLKVWHRPGDNNKALIYFGGNAEDVFQNVEKFKELFPDYSLYLLNYRGYGGSSGQSTEEAFFSDSLALHREVKKKHSTIVVMGRSLGTGVAVFLASQKEVNRLILTTPFDSMTRLAASYYPFVPVALLLKDRFESISYAAGIDIPTLVLIAEHDEVIPAKRSRALVASLNPALTLVKVIPGTGHNTIESHQLYEDTVRRFIATR